MADRKLNIIVTADDKASSILSKATKSVGDNLSKISLAGAAAGAGIVAGVKSSLSAYAESERAQRQLEHAVIAVSGGTMDQVKAISAAADALQKKAGIDGDALKVGAAQLSTFGLQTQSVQDLTKSLADFTVSQSGATAGAQDYESSANTIAKALNGQFGQLERVGVRFTETQQAMILNGTEAEKVAAIQEGLAQNLKETTDTLGGVDGAAGRLTQSLGDISENIGAAFAPALDQLTASVLPIVEKISEWAAKNPELVQTIIMIAGAVAGFLAVLAPVAAALTFLISPIGLVVVAVGVLIAIVVALIMKWDEFKVSVIAVWEAVRASAVSIWEAIKAFFIGIMEGIKSVFITAWEAIKTTFIAAWEALKTTVTTALQAISAAITTILMTIGIVIQTFVTTVIEFFRVAWEALRDTIIAAWQAISGAITTVLASIGGAISAFIGGVKTVFQTGWEGIKGIVITVSGAIGEAIGGFITSVIEKFTGFFGNIKATWQEFWGGLSGVASGFLGGIKGAVDGLFQKISAVINKLIELKDKAKNALGIGGGGGGGGGGKGGGGAFATGGNAFAGQSALVGEHGPERVVFGRGANIVPANRMGGGGGLSINVTVTGNTMLADDRDVATSIGDVITQQFRLSNKFS